MGTIAVAKTNIVETRAHHQFCLSFADTKTVATNFSIIGSLGDTGADGGPNGSGKEPRWRIAPVPPKLRDHFWGSVQSLTVLSCYRYLQTNGACLLLAFQYPVEVPGLAIWQFLWQSLLTAVC